MTQLKILSMRSVLLTITVMLLLLSAVQADNWPHWRGDNGNSVSLTATPPIEWSATKNVKWKTKVPGSSSGSPVIWEDRVFIVTAVGSGATGDKPISELVFKVLCYDRETGKPLWEKDAVTAKPHQKTHSTNGFASASPCTDGERVYAHFGSRGIFCYTIDGEFVWKRDDLGNMETRNDFGEGSSPTLAGSKLIVPWDHEGPSYIAALDKLTGKTIWKQARDEPTCWATPLIVEHGGKKQVVMNGQTCARAYDLETGKELWRCGGQTQRPAASAVAAGGMVYVGSGFRGAFLGAFKLNGSGDIAGTDSVAWSVDRDTPDIASPVLSGDRLYFHKGKKGVISCLNAKTGEPYFASQRLPNLSTIYASPVAAGGHVYFTGRSGNTVVIKDTGKLEVVATNSLGETIDATPAPVDNELFIRGENHLFCLAKPID